MPWWRRTQGSAKTKGSAQSEGSASERRFRWIGGRRYAEVSSHITAKDASSDQFHDFQHFIIRRVLGGNHLAPLTQPQTILDVGCGTGRWSIEMAAEFPGTRVAGLDLVRPGNATPMLASLGPLAGNVAFVEADILKGLPFPDSTFDYVHVGLMYSELAASSWPEVIRDLVRVTKPNGWVECVEPGLAIYDPGPAYQLAMTWIAEVCRARGLEPDLGPKLKGLLEGNGLVQVTEYVIPCFSDLTQSRERRLWQTQSLSAFENLFRIPVIEAGIASPAEFKSVYEALKQEFEQGKYADSDPIYVVFGRRMSVPSR